MFFAADLWEVYKGRAVEDYQNLVEEVLNNYGENPRVYKNTVFFLVPMESEILIFDETFS